MSENRWWRGLAAGCIVLGGLMPVGPTSAQLQGFGAWGLACQALGPGKTRCALFQRRVQEGTNALILEVQVLGLEAGETPALALTVPLGVWLAGGVRTQVDNGEASTALYQSCTGQGCFARIEDEALVGRLEAGREMHITYSIGPDTGQAITTTLSLIGFREGVGTIREAAQAQPPRE